MRIILGTILALAAVTAQAAPFSAEDEALYNQRFGGTGLNALESYDPVEAVPGAAGAAPLAPSGRVTIDAAALDKARAYAAANNSSALLVWRAGRLEEASYFGKTTATTPLISRSLAKPISAIAVGRAIALGKISSLDAPMADYVTEWRGTPKAAVTVRQVLNMTSGFLAQGFSSDPTNMWSRAYLHPRHDQIIVDDYPLTDPPGQVYGYANATADMVALLIERATGRRYAEFISTEILKPLGAMGGTIWVDRVGGLAHSGCCILLPADSWLRMAILLMQDGDWQGRALLPPGYVKAMRTGSQANPFYGLGLWVAPRFISRRGFMKAPDGKAGVLHGEPFAADDLFMFDGNADQIVYIVPSRKLVILRTGAAPPTTPEWDNAVLPNLILRGVGG